MARSITTGSTALTKLVLTYFLYFPIVVIPPCPGYTFVLSGNFRIVSIDLKRSFLSEYEKGWKEAFGQKIKRNYLVKELLLDMDDKTLNKLAQALEKVKFDEISTHGLVKEVAKNLPISTKLNALIKHGKEIKEIRKL